MLDINQNIHKIIEEPTIRALLSECSSEELIAFSQQETLSGPEIGKILFLSDKCLKRMEEQYGEAFIKSDEVFAQVYHLLNRIVETSSRQDISENTDKLLADLELLAVSVLNSENYYAMSVNTDDVTPNATTIKLKSALKDYGVLGILLTVVFGFFGFYMNINDKINRIEFQTDQLYRFHDEYIAKSVKNVINDETFIKGMTDNICSNQTFLTKIRSILKKKTKNDSVQLKGNLAFMSKNLKGYTINGTKYDPDKAFISLNLESSWEVDKEVIKSYLHKEIFVFNAMEEQKIIPVKVIDFSSNSDTNSTIGVVSMSIFEKLGGTEKLGVLKNCSILLPSN